MYKHLHLTLYRGGLNAGHVQYTLVSMHAHCCLGHGATLHAQPIIASWSIACAERNHWSLGNLSQLQAQPVSSHQPGQLFCDKAYCCHSSP